MIRTDGFVQVQDKESHYSGIHARVVYVEQPRALWLDVDGILVRFTPEQVYSKHHTVFRRPRLGAALAVRLMLAVMPWLPRHWRMPFFHAVKDGVLPIDTNDPRNKEWV